MGRLSMAKCILARTVSVTLLVSAPAFGLGDFWVDPSTGSDTATGTSINAPLRTLSEANSRTTAGDRVWLLPGRFNSVSGESFPLDVPEQVHLESVEGPSSTVIENQAAPPGFGRLIQLNSGSSLTGVTVLGDEGQELVYCRDTAPAAIARNCVFQGGEHGLFFGGGQCVLEGCRLDGQGGSAVEVSVNSEVDLRLSRCTITGTHTGVGCFVPPFSPQVFVELDRCEVIGLTGSGVDLFAADSGNNVVRASGCVFRGNRIGIKVSGFDPWVSSGAQVEHCTFVDNAQYGVDLAMSPLALSYIDSVLFSRNGVRGLRLGSFAQLPVDSSHLQETYSGQGSGNLMGDPGFVEPASGDYSLRADSQCVDAGSVTPSLPAVDISGQRRIVDGDLDLSAAPDIGALELQPLVGPFSINVGTPAIYGVSGQAGGFSTIVVAPSGFAAGATTQYGTLFLNAIGAVRLTPVMTTGGGPTWVNLGPFVDSSWVGTTIGLQALTRSSLAPAGGAFTNPIPVLVR